MWWITAILVIATMPSLMGRSEIENSPYRVVVCLATPRSVGLRSDGGQEGPRVAVLMDRDRQILLESARAEGLLDWKDVISIRVKQSSRYSDRKFLTINYRDYQTKIPISYEMGLVDSNCLTRIKKRYQAVLNFIEDR
jgi:hypothetical protein